MTPTFAAARNELPPEVAAFCLGMARQQNNYEHTND
jgi:hypothetical protein